MLCTQFIKAHALAIISIFGCTVVVDVSQHFELFQELKIIGANQHCGRLTILGDLDAFPSVTGAAYGVREALSKGPNGY